MSNDLQSQDTNYKALITLTTVFFFWGFIAAGNSIFVPFCKDFFKLDQFQSQLIDFAFYGAYYFGALILFIAGSTRGKDIIGKWGYKRSIIYGLLLSALGAGIMIISVDKAVFLWMLFGLFVVGLGFSIQQTSANPFMISLGEEKTGINRINLGGAINSFGTTIGPLLIGLALFGSTKAIEEDMITSLDLTKVEILYAFVGALFLVVAIIFSLSKKLPAMINDEKLERSNKALGALIIITLILATTFVPVFQSYRSGEQKDLVQLEQAMDMLHHDEDGKIVPNLSQTQIQTEKAIQTEINKIKTPLDQNRMMWLSLGLVSIVGGLLVVNILGKRQKSGWGAMQYPQLTLGMLAIFTYVGVEVAIGSNLSELLKSDEILGLQSSETAPYIAMFWGSLMIGRWGGSINVFRLSRRTKMILRFIVPLVALGIILSAAKIAQYDIEPFRWYFLCVLVQIAAFYITDDKPGKTLSIFGLLGIISVLVGLSSEGIYAVYAFLSAGLFCSIMWSAIFSLSLAGLGKYQSQGSAFLVMMILGGAIIPPIQGKLVDIIGVQNSFIIALLCFMYITLFAFLVKRILNRQGVAFE